MATTMLVEDLTNDAFWRGYDAGTENERERIIKLLEDMNGLDDWYQGTIDKPDGPYIDRKDAIALIKGEQK